jgi:iron complex outermembrane receptor protein
MAATRSYYVQTLLGTIGLSVLVAAPVNTAFAQGANANAKKAQSGLEEVVVTAQRRSQNIQDVPLAVTSFSSRSLEVQQITNTLDIARVVPNFFAANNVGQASANVYFIRGLGQTQSFPTFEPQVGTYIDDIYLGRQNANNFALFGIDQLQVLRGPQGTLFGRNSTGGAIVVSLQKPADTFGGMIETGYGRYGRFTARASIDLPINSELTTRTSVFGITDEGFVQNLTTKEKMNWTHNWGVREALRYNPAKYGNVEWNVSGDYSRNDAANVLNQPGPGGVDGSGRVSYSGFSKVGGALAGPFPLSPGLSGKKGQLGQGVLVESYGIMSNLKVGFDAGTLNLITGWRGLTQLTGVDFPFTGLGPANPYDFAKFGQFSLAQDLKSSQFSQEVKWTADLSTNFKYTVGAFYLSEQNKNNFGAVLNIGALVGLPAFPALYTDEFTRNDTTSEAVYAQGDYKISDPLTLTVGARFTHEEKKLTAVPAGLPANGFTTADIAKAGYLTTLKTNQFTPRVALEYRINPDVMTFISATKGFQGGGWNGLTNSAATFNNFSPETVWSYEAGIRTETADKKLRFNVTGFYQDVKDYQLLSDANGSGNFNTYNGSDLRAYGAEFELTWRPIEPLTVTSSLGLIDAEYYNPKAFIVSQQKACAANSKSAGCGQGIVNLSGGLAEPSNTPPVTFATSVSYDFNLPSVDVTPTIGLQWVDKDNVSTSGLPGGINKAMTLVDAGVTFRPVNTGWSITAECRNCTMKDYSTAYLFGYRYYNTPGIWNVKAQYRF